MSREQLVQVEPDYRNEFVPRPFSLTPDELGELPVTVAKGPTQVLAWVRYPAVAERVRGVALAWTQRAVYVEWEDRGIHRVWVWASAVERAADGAAGAAVVAESPRASAISALGTEPLVQLVNVELALIGAEFVRAMSKPTGAFSSVVFGTIDGQSVHLDFLIDPATDMCAVLLVSMEIEALPGQSAGPTFEEAIQAYPWAVAVDALDLG
ncbi:hypothetical protein [Cryobacterium sp. PH29-G1]|uniref:hypothetical protein n=1 Tax=Cryobacterium sp. PH29-G1 TaxID=3046211 RepID=UPI0024B8E81F|nr:hypothetical protein [Cryobacterium sp. PH29-G1]MDJ0350867.1 hypothetical protein [Cryobacterium sp. PH29-G1]